MAACAVGLFAARPSTDAAAQPTGKPPRVGVLVMAEKPGELPVDAFRLGMRDLGYVDGRNVVLEWRYADGKPERLPALVAELVRLGVDVLYCAGPDPAAVAKTATSTIPIVVVGARDPVEMGWAATLGRPGGNITGFLVVVPGLFGKNLSLLKEAAPRVTRVAVLRGAATARSPGPAALLKELEDAARQLGLQLRPFDVKGPADFEGAFKAASEWQADALLLLAYGPDIADLHRRAATYVDKILKGARPGERPFQQPVKLEMVINLKTAKALSLRIPPSLPGRADHVLD